MNVYLIPYTLFRHFTMALALAAMGLICWWVALAIVILGVPLTYDWFGWIWSQRADGVVMLGLLTFGVAFGSVMGEGALRRRPLPWRMVYAGLAGGGALLGFWSINAMYAGLIQLLAGEGTQELLADVSFVSLRYHMFAWINAGFWAGFGPFVVRRMHGGITRRLKWAGRDTEHGPKALTWEQWASSLLSHVGGGLVAGALAAAMWHVPGHYPSLGGDLYVSSALACATFGALHGLLCWGIPDDLYAGWVRVLSAERFGLRIPVPHADGAGAERFVGHFPRGLDLYLPADRGVAELHVSFVVDDDQHYTVRGLSVHPVTLKRTLERVDLRYDPTRPAPLETALRMEDRILLGDDGSTVVEFVMLPREEQ